MSKIKLTKFSPVMMVTNVRKTIEFYQKELGFSFMMAVPKVGQEVLMEMPDDKELVYALVKRDAVEIQFQEKESLQTDVPALNGIPIGASVSMYMEVECLDDLYNAVKHKVEIVKELFTTWYGMKEFYMKDNNGYVLCFAEKA